jgi:hypothetical protein
VNRAPEKIKKIKPRLISLLFTDHESRIKENEEWRNSAILVRRNPLFSEAAT